MLWDLLHFYSSLWASCTTAFREVPLSVLQLNWTAVCDSKIWVSWRLSLYIVFFKGVYSYFDQILYFEGRTSHPSLGFFSFSCISSFSCIFSSFNIFFFVYDKKEIKIEINPNEDIDVQRLFYKKEILNIMNIE